MNKDDRNTALIIIFVLVVCTISLIAIAGSLWSIVAPGVNGVLAFVGFNVRLANANYNFQVPAIADITPPSPSSTVPGSSPEGGLDNVIRSFDYNFTIPSAGDSTQGGQRDAILYDAQLLDTSMLPATPQAEGSIIIPKINMNVPVIASQDPLAGLEVGMWTYPSRDAHTLLCFRSYSPSNSGHSCLNLDRLAVGDQAWWRFTDDDWTEYRVVGVNTFAAGDTSVYSPLDGLEYLRLVTTAPLGSSAQRLVVLLQAS